LRRYSPFRLGAYLFQQVHDRIPVDIPPQWHDPLVLLGVVFSVSNVGYYRRTGKVFIVQILMMVPRLFTPLAPILKEGPNWWHRPAYTPIQSLTVAGKLDDYARITTEVCFSAAVLFLGLEHLAFAVFALSRNLAMLRPKLMLAGTQC
jgi:hypothetical protein